MLLKNDSLIEALVADLRPVKPLSFGLGMLAAAAGAALALAGVSIFAGLRADFLIGPHDPVFLISTGIFLMLGIAASVAVVGMSRPQVGSEHGGWVWAAAMAALLPLTAIVVWLFRPADSMSGNFVDHGTACLLAGCGFGIFVGAALTFWLRRGAPTSAALAGLLTGIAAGSLGTFAFSLHCTYNDIVHIGLWHGAVVAVSAAVGRLIIPTLVRW